MTMTQTKTASLQKKSFKSPDETRPFKGKGKLELIKFGETPIGRATFEPGWRWSENVKPIAGTDSCQAPHLLYCTAGRMKVTSVVVMATSRKTAMITVLRIRMIRQ